MNFKLILCRHSESAHNVEKNQAKSSTKAQQGYYQQTQKYKKIKYNPKLIDAKDIDSNQVIQNKQIFDMQSISLIITSPLNRCLQAIKILIEGHKNIEVIVEPLLTARLSSAWSIGAPLQQKIQENSSFNFQFANKTQKNWYFDLLDQKCKIKYQKNNFDPESILEFISEGFTQSQQSIQTRVKQFKHKLKTVYNPRSENKKILILSHSSILQAMMATKINQKGRAISSIEFNHSLPIYVDYEYFMNGTILI